MTPAPGEIYLADVFEGGTRPVVVVSRGELNRGTLFLVAPITSSRVSERRSYANYVFLPSGGGSGRRSIFPEAEPCRLCRSRRRRGDRESGTDVQTEVTARDLRGVCRALDVRYDEVQQFAAVELFIPHVQDHSGQAG